MRVVRTLRCVDNQGGAVADDRATKDTLLDVVVSLREDVRYLESRLERPER